jgi:hypothetical protein
MYVRPSKLPQNRIPQRTKGKAINLDATLAWAEAGFYIVPVFLH